MRPTPTTPPTAPTTPPPGATPAPGRGRGRGGSGFASSESTPLVVNGVMYLSTPYYRVVALDADDRQGDVGVSAAVGQSIDARRRVLAGRREDAAADRLRIERRQALFARREDGHAERRVRRERHRQPRHAGDPARPARPQRPQLAADRLPEPRDYRRDDAGESAAGTGRRRAGVGSPHRQAGVDVPFRAARRREVQRHVGRRELEEPHRASTSGASSPSTPHAASSTCRSGRRRSISTAAIARGQPVRDEPRRRRCQHRQVSLALPDRSSRHLGRRPVRRSRALDVTAGQQNGAGRRGDQQGRTAVHPRPRDRQAAVRRRGAPRAAERSAARADRQDAAVPAQAAAALAHVDVAGRRRDGHAGAGGRRVGS